MCARDCSSWGRRPPRVRPMEPSSARFMGSARGSCARTRMRRGCGEDHEILDEGLAGRLRRQAFAQALGEFVGDGHRTEAVDLIAAYTADRARATVLGVYAELRSRGARAPRLPPPQPGRAPIGQAELLRAAELDEAARARGTGRGRGGRPRGRAVGRAAERIRRALRRRQAGSRRAGLRRSGAAGGGAARRR